MKRIPKFRRGRTLTAIATLVATTGALLLVSAAPASAVTSDWAVNGSGDRQVIYPGTANQPARDEVVTTSDSGGGVTVGDQLKLTVDDNSAGDNCALTNDFIEFAAPPTLTVDAPTTGAPTYSVALASSAGPCNTAGKKDQVVITATTSGASGSFTLSGIMYNTGALVEAGNVTVTGTGTGGVTDNGMSNATVVLLKVSGNTPPVGIVEGSSGNPISDVTIQEFKPGDLGTGFVCVAFNIPTGSMDIKFSNAGTASASGGGATASGAQLGSGNTAATVPDSSMTFATTASTGTPGLYTLSGLMVNSITDEKFGTIQVGFSSVNRATACDDSDSPDDGANVDHTIPIVFVAAVNRLGGGDRFATAQIIFDDAFGCQATAIIARGDNFPDALAASYLAGFEGTGILLVNTDSIPASTLNALRLEGVKNVILIGGTSAISQGVQDQLAALGQTDCGGAPVAANPQPKVNVSRIGGQTRYATAQNVAEFPGLTNPGATDMGLDAKGAGGANNCQLVVTAIVASGENFPDALAAGPIAYSGTHGACGSGTELPMLLTAKDSLSPEAAAALVNLNVKQVILMGGTAAVSTVTETQITALGINVIRVAGSTRQLTAAALATLTANDQNFAVGDGNFGLARGDTFPDALTLGPSAGSYRNDNPGGEAILLTDSTTSLGSAAADVLTKLSSMIFNDDEHPECSDDIHVAGGTGALSAGVVTEALNAAAAQPLAICKHSTFQDA